MKVLIVDDNRDNLEMLGTLLSGNGYEVSLSVNGKEALEKLYSERFNLIISDVLMPVMDGFRLCQECKKDKKLKVIPFIFYTATYVDKKDEEFALYLGAQKFIRKPKTPDKLLEIVKGIFNNAHELNMKPQKSLTEEKKDVLELYSERLINKLEKKMLDLESEINKRKQVEMELRQLSKKQAVLLKEVNHRVRNNLTALLSMVFSEKDLLERKKLHKYIPFLNDLTARIQGLSVVHTMLTDSGWENLKLDQLCKKVINATLKYIYSSKRIKLNIISSDVFVDSNQAHNLALIINELFTNSLKYALQDRDRIAIEIKITEEDGNIVFRYSDDGPGYPQEMIRGDYSKISTGFELISGTIKHSILGRLKLSNDNGAVTTIVFGKV